MFAQSVAWPDSIAVARDLARSAKVRLATLNNESEELNRYRIDSFGLRDVFPTFFTSCWLGVRKPTRHIYERVLGMTQSTPARTLFIDDRLQNLGPAASLGIRTVQFADAEKLRADLSALGLSL
jgi:putative hydrolase of the HAD superfamily